VSHLADGHEGPMGLNGKRQGHELECKPGKRKRPQVVLDRDGILVLYKPPHWTMTTTAAMPRARSIQAWLCDNVGHRYPFLRKDPLQAGLVQRLDVETSGLVVVATQPKTFQQAWQLRSAGQFYREYIVLLHGLVPVEHCMGTLSYALKTDRWSTRVCERTGLPATTRYQAIGAYTRQWQEWDGSRRCSEHFTLIRARIFTGRTHQIRVHLRELARELKLGVCGVVGDYRYLPRSTMDSDKDFCPRVFLHAKVLRFPFPGKEGGHCSVSCDLPADLEDVLQNLIPHREATAQYQKCAQLLVRSAEPDPRDDRVSASRAVEDYEVDDAYDHGYGPPPGTPYRDEHVERRPEKARKDDDSRSPSRWCPESDEDSEVAAKGAKAPRPGRRMRARRSKDSAAAASPERRRRVRRIVRQSRKERPPAEQHQEQKNGNARAEELGKQQERDGDVEAEKKRNKLPARSPEREGRDETSPKEKSPKGKSDPPKEKSKSPKENSKSPKERRPERDDKEPRGVDKRSSRCPSENGSPVEHRSRRRRRSPSEKAPSERRSTKKPRGKEEPRKKRRRKRSPSRWRPVSPQPEIKQEVKEEVKEEEESQGEEDADIGVMMASVIGAPPSVSPILTPPSSPAPNGLDERLSAKGVVRPSPPPMLPQANGKKEPNGRIPGTARMVKKLRVKRSKRLEPKIAPKSSRRRRSSALEGILETPRRTRATSPRAQPRRLAMPRRIPQEARQTFKVLYRRRRAALNTLKILEDLEHVEAASPKRWRPGGVPRSRSRPSQETPAKTSQPRDRGKRHRRRRHHDGDVAMSERCRAAMETMKFADELLGPNLNRMLEVVS